VVRALSPADGSTVWRASTERNDVRRLAADGATVYVTTDGGRAANGGVLSFADGERRWRFLPTEVAVARFDSLAVAADAVLAAGQNVGGSGWHVALDPASGERRWFTPGVVNSRALTVADGALVAGGLHGTVMAQSVGDGTIRWRRDVGPGVEAIATDGETAVVAGKDEDGDNCRAVSMRDGSERWSTPVGRTVLGARDRVVLAGDGRVRGVAADTGEVRWERSPGTTPRGLALADDVLYSVGYSGTLRALTA
jgi:outer membrane protein assembly factor BamB